LSSLLCAQGTLLYNWARREQTRRVFSPAQCGMFLSATAGFAMAVHGFVTGYISI